MKPSLLAPVSLSLLLSFPGILAAKNTAPLQPAAYWSFERCTQDGGAILDGGSGAHNLTLRGAACATGRYGAGARFDGIDDVAESEPGVLNFDDRLTIAAWVYPESTDGVQTIVNKWYALDSYSLSIQGGSFAFTLAFRGGGPWGTTVDVRAPAVANAWSHVVGVFDGKSQTASLYVNGVLRGVEVTPRKHLQQSERPVAVGNHPEWNPLRGRIDEVALYDAVLTGDQVKALAGLDAPPHHGADTSVKPWTRQYPDGEANGYDIYLGRLGFDLYPCSIQDRYGNDVLTWEKGDPAEKCQFIYEAATIARPERTYAYWWVVGPAHPDAAAYFSPYEFGMEQARRLIEQRRMYGHLIGGRTLFGDVERSRTAPDTSGWEQCKPFESAPGACARNREVLEGFLHTIAAADGHLVPGVYTRADIWVAFFGADYLPLDAAGERQQFALWLAGCSITSGCGKARDAGAVEMLLPTAEQTVLGGMGTVLWQHHVNCADYDATSSSTSGLLAPRPVPEAEGIDYRCTCEDIGGYCPATGN